MASETEIANRAIQRVGGTRVTSIDDTGSKAARECKTAYVPLRDALLRAYVWSFSIGRAALAKDTTGPTFTPPSNAFSFPNDAQRILLTNDADNDWIIEGRKILTDWDAPLNVRYVKQITDPNIMDPLFREALAMRIAHAICEPITGSNVKQEGIRQDYKAVIEEAARVGGLEKLAEVHRETDWITVRT